MAGRGGGGMRILGGLKWWPCLVTFVACDNGKTIKLAIGLQQENGSSDQLFDVKGLAHPEGCWAGRQEAQGLFLTCISYPLSGTPSEPGLVAHACHPSTLEVVTGRL